MIKINQFENVLKIEVDTVHFSIPVVKDLFVRSSSESGGYENHLLMHRSIPGVSISIWINESDLSQVIFKSKSAFASAFQVPNSEARKLLVKLIEVGITK